MFSKKNTARVKEGHAPVVDAKMIAHNPGWEQYRNQPLVHHHIGGDGEAVAVPKIFYCGFDGCGRTGCRLKDSERNNP